ncbi:MAG TPA: TetR family transcriptional regulator [Thermoleophilaceae bacterium]|nr:TetR family transcriptional regulator [Thermoleophilaceae bacterium]
MGRTNVPRGEARREAIVRAALELIGEQGLDAVTHRALADRAGVPLSATTYWFASKDDILQEALLVAAREEVDRLERVVLSLAGKELDVSRWADAVAAELAAELEEDPARQVAFTELVLEGTRRPWLREEVARWEEAFLRLAELGLRATGSPEPVTDARLVVATVTGLMIGQLTNPQPDFEEQVFRPALERLFTRLVEREAVPA